MHDSATGETWTKSVSFYTDTLRTPGEYEADFAQRFLSETEYKTISLIGLDFTAVLHDSRRPR